jgi:hypothetical protein
MEIFIYLFIYIIYIFMTFIFFFSLFSYFQTLVSLILFSALILNSNLDFLNHIFCFDAQTRKSPA